MRKVPAVYALPLLAAFFSAAPASAQPPSPPPAPEPRVTVGDRALPVHIWEFDHELWNARFRQPYLVLSSPSPALSCTYDIMAGTAVVARS